MSNRVWHTSRREIPLAHPLVMGILNATPDSFSDGGEFLSVDAALRRAEAMIVEGADIIDIGGESTRPGSSQINAEEEIKRTRPIIAAIVKRVDIPISVDTSKLLVAHAAIDSGAEIINDISGLRFDERIAKLAADSGAGLVLMHSRGAFHEMHALEPVADIFAEVTASLAKSLKQALDNGVRREQVVLDPGIGFGKTPKQNLELIGTLDRMVEASQGVPIMVGASRKSFIGKLLGDVPTDDRFAGSLAAATIAIWNGASILRVHDVKATVEILKTVDAIRSAIKSGDLVMSTA